MSVISRNRWNFTRHAVSCYISANGVFEVSNHARMGMFVGWLLNWQFRLSFKQCSRAQITMKFRGQCFVVKKNERIRRDMRIRFSSLKNFRKETFCRRFYKEMSMFLRQIDYIYIFEWNNVYFYIFQYFVR